MQIITGKYRARKLVAVDAKTTRPTLARVKESTFNLIQGRIDGAVVLDLFAGSGAFGAECISRGAKKVVFVDKERKAVETIKVNTRNMTEDFEILNTDYLSALKLLAGKNLKFDLVYLDPPYKSEFASIAMQELEKLNLLEQGATIAFEHDLENNLQNVPDCYIMEKSRKYGIAIIDIYTFIG